MWKEGKMWTKTSSKTAIALIVCLVATLSGLPTISTAGTLTGASGSSSQWGSGWIDLAPAVDFKKGDRLKLLIGGTANKILVRLLPKGQSPDTSVGLVGGPVDVPKSRVVEVELTQDRKQVIQISVHGGPNPWGKFLLGHDNGPASLESAELIEP